MLLKTAMLVLYLIGRAASHPDSAALADSFSRVPTTYFFMVLFVPSFVVVVTMILYFLVYFIIAAAGSALLGIFPFFAAVPVWGRIAISLAVAGGCYVAARKWRQREPKGTVANLNRLRRGSAEFYGNKAASLGLLSAAGLRVPFGFAFSSELYKRFAEQNKIFDPYGVDLGGASLADALNRTRCEIRAGGFSFADSILLRRAYFSLWLRGGKEPIIIVRSSFGGEDAPGKLAPGQYASYATKGSYFDFVKTVRECWCSFYSEAAHEYRSRMGAPFAPSLGFIVQNMLSPRYIGTAAAADPATGYREKYVVDISAPPVGGEGRVSEQGEADTAVVDMAMEFQHPGRGGKYPFMRELIKGLSALCRAGEDAPVVEWAWSGDKLYFLQMRPLAGLPMVETYIAAGMAEMSREIFTPLTMSLIERERPLDSFIIEPLKKYKDVKTDGSIIRRIEGRVYASYRELCRLRDESAVSAGEFFKFLRATDECAKEAGQGIEEMDKALAALKGKNFAAMDAAQLKSEITSLNKKLQGDGAGRQAVVAHLTLALSGILDMLGEAYGVPAGKISALQMYERGCVALERDRLMRSIISAAVPQPEGRAVSVPPLGVQEKDWVDYMEKFGCLGPADEMDLSIARVFEKPERLAERVNLLAGGPQGKAPAASDIRVPREVIGDALIPWDSFIFKKAYAKARRHATLREELRHRLFMGWSALRTMILELASREPFKEILSEPGDVFYLEASELLDGNPPADAAARAAERKKQRAEWESRPSRMSAHLNAAGEILDGPAVSADGETSFSGLPSSPGVARGIGRYVATPEDIVIVRKGDIILADICSPWMSALLSRAEAVAAMSGGVASHLSLSAREYGVPMLVGVVGCEPAKLDGRMLEVDAAAGVLRVLEDQP